MLQLIEKASRIYQQENTTDLRRDIILGNTYNTQDELEQIILAKSQEIIEKYNTKHSSLITHAENVLNIIGDGRTLEMSKTVESLRYQLFLFKQAHISDEELKMTIMQAYDSTTN